jgi:hypothetical protein
VKAGDEVFVDTNVIIAAFGSKAWKPLAQFFRLLTADQCAIEAATGDQRRKDYVTVDDALLRKTATIVKPEKKSLATLTLSLPRGLFLDPGERDLIACAIDRPAAWLLCSPDKAAVRAMHTLGKIAQLVSFEALVRAAKFNIQLYEPFTEKWLRGVRTQLELETL